MWSEGVDSFGSNVRLESSGGTERDFALFVAAGRVFLEAVTGVGDIAGWRGGVATGVDVSERTAPTGA